jgi:hypothetical protein
MAGDFQRILDQTPFGFPIRLAGAAFSPAALGGSSIPLDAYGNVDINAVGRQLASPVKLPLPMNEKGEINIPSAAEQFGDYAFPEQAKKTKEDSEEKKESENKTETETETETDGSSTKDPNTGPLNDQEPDIPYGGLMDVVEGLLDRQATIRDRELAAEMQRYVLQGALRQQGLKELSRRAIEQKNIEAWNNLQVARQYAQAQQATALATTAYLSQIPNYNVMQAMNEGMKAGMQNIQIQAPTPPQPRSYFRGVG